MGCIVRRLFVEEFPLFDGEHCCIETLFPSKVTRLYTFNNNPSGRIESTLGFIKCLELVEKFQTREYNHPRRSHEVSNIKNEYNL